MKKTLQKGFTLIELLVVIAIIAILSAIVITSLAPAQEKAKVAAFQSEVRSASAGFVIACDDGAIVLPASTANVDWDDMTASTDVVDDDCATQLGAFKVGPIPPVASIDECASIEDGTVTFTGAACV